METILITIHIVITLLTPLSVIKLSNNKKITDKMDNIYISYKNGYGLDSKECYPY